MSEMSGNDRNEAWHADAETIRWIEQVKVSKGFNEQGEFYFDIENEPPLTYLGNGVHGVVYQIDDVACVKIYGDKYDWRAEHRLLKKCGEAGLFPKLYAVGELYIIMELLHGMSLKDYLEEHPMTRELAAQIVQTLELIKKTGVSEVDQHLHHFWIEPDGNFRVIDVVESNWIKQLKYPEKLLREMSEEHRDPFLEYVMQLNPKLFRKWVRAADWPY